MRSRAVPLVLATIIAVGGYGLVVSADDAAPAFDTMHTGDTWASMAAQHGVTEAQLRAANNVSANAGMGQDGRVVFIPTGLAPPATTTTTTVAATTTTLAPTTTVASTTTLAATTTTAAPATTVAPPAGFQFSENFASPAGMNRFVFETHHDLQEGSMNTPPLMWEGDHSMACQPPNVPNPTRTIHRDIDSEHQYYCAPGGPDSGHFMTSFTTEGYGQVDFAPNQIFNDVTKVCWDVNATSFGGREWFAVTIVKESDFQADTSQAGLRNGIDVQDFPDNGGSLFYTAPGFGPGAAGGGKELPPTGFMLVGLEGSTATYNGQTGSDVNYQGQRVGADKATRFPWCMEDLPGNVIKFTIGRNPALYPFVASETRTLAGEFPDGQVRVIFGDDSYDPMKGDAGQLEGGTFLNQNTWHWDNIQVS